MFEGENALAVACKANDAIAAAILMQAGAKPELVPEETRKMLAPEFWELIAPQKWPSSVRKLVYATDPAAAMR